MKRFLMIGLTVCLLLAATASADTLVNLQGSTNWTTGQLVPNNFEDSTSDLNGDSTLDAVAGHSLTAATITDSLGTVQSGSLFLAGVNYRLGNTTTNTSSEIVDNGAGNDFMRLAYSPNGGRVVRALAFWSSSEFLSAGTYTMGDLTSINAVASAGDNTPSYLRYVVKVNNTFYASEVQENLPDGDGTPVTFGSFSADGTALGATSWRAFDPENLPTNNTDLDDFMDLAGTTTTLLATDEIQGVGVIMGSDFFGDSTAFGSNLRLSSFSAEAVPEPTTLGLIGLGAIGFLRRRR